ncbi:hypothetical protein AMES_4498 [Amycolatopsis mediterranei S699]|uniref:DUF305 domain-containing protein n=2 Tax=Amycolatopsis mediterranei TaxID=33910 RepID=A0A0H3D8C6_AMYMU|nr:DUF305 domain-containing protein [Amycolatopsis mediterranei]ADJ46323.1 conserved hypothetical protein [Amycolatopsis mediterranei U32]AEK43117.1 hypothetical protein RAM_23185 [Amycolatopsis mediterranei S699]AFO78034.1 hypothetical protein AMES_4498 [Amycolatopsis mediterranei S699]AGT85162.1 hypothetical protein B737_4498 [Amycolatopsis mediterranei RB]KDO06223.1 hypothetical protein DV26_34505 [Amycolatopsis mediterranei]
MRRLVLGAAVVALIMGGCATTTAPAPTTTPQAFNPTDVAWLQLVVPMTENALTAARLAPEHTASAAVRSAAEACSGPQDRLLTRLRAVRDRAGLPAGDVHSGHRMPGMVTAADLVALRTEQGSGFDRRLVALLRAHAAQLVVLARGEQASGADAETRELAREVGAEGTRESEVLPKTA